MFSVHGSSGSNWIVPRALALERSDALVLVARSIHHSVINALKAFGLGFRFLPTPYEPRFEALLPPSVEEVLDGLARYPDALAVLYTSPTYEGLAATTSSIVEAVHAASEHAMVIVDEAWGGHLHFHPELPRSAMAAAADVCVQSTHKLAGGLQQTGLIHWREGRVDSELMEEAYREYVTTSPSYHLLASADAAVRTLAAQGEQALGTAIARTRALKAQLRARLPDLDHLDEPSWLAAAARHVAGHDLVKTTVGLSRYALSGYEVFEALVQRGIVVEKAGVNTITLITTFQLGPDAVDDTVAALAEILAGHVLPGGAREPMAANPFSAIDDRPVMHPYAARRYAKSIGHELPLREAVGKVAAEHVEVYPPGIPVILEGFRVSADAVDYLIEARDKGGSIVARDTSLETLRVL
jgi:lysine decarboxylase